MVTDNQVRRLMKLIQTERTLTMAAAFGHHLHREAACSLGF
jgi:hypothetical protein